MAAWSDCWPLHVLLRSLTVKLWLASLRTLDLTLSFSVLQPVVRKQHNTGFKHKARLQVQLPTALFLKNLASKVAACGRAGERAQLLHDV